MLSWETDALMKIQVFESNSCLLYPRLILKQNNDIYACSHKAKLIFIWTSWLSEQRPKLEVEKITFEALFWSVQKKNWPGWSNHWSLGHAVERRPVGLVTLYDSPSLYVLLSCRLCGNKLWPLCFSTPSIDR